jgi:hypothetical protein
MIFWVAVTLNGGKLTTIITVNNISIFITGYDFIAISVVFANYYTIINDASRETISLEVIATTNIIFNIRYFPVTTLGFCNL